MKMFCAPLTKPTKGAKKLPSGGFGGFGTFCEWRCRYFEISTGGHFRIRRPLKPVSRFQLNHGGNQVKGELVTTRL